MLRVSVISLLSLFFLFSCNESHQKLPPSPVEVIAKEDPYKSYAPMGDEGLRIAHHKKGTGKTIESNSVVVMHVKGIFLPQRRDIMDTYATNTPFSGQLGNDLLVEGLEKALVGMHVGDVFDLFVPWQLGYGDTVFKKIPPKANLHFSVVVIDILDPVLPLSTEGIAPIVSKSGVRIYIHKQGKGSPPKKGETVTVHYQGFFENDGKKFDSTYDKQKPFSFRIKSGEVIQGWEDAFNYLRPGSLARILVPSNIAYGIEGYMDVKPNSNLIFDIEYLQ